MWRTQAYRMVGWVSQLPVLIHAVDYFGDMLWPGGGLYIEQYKRETVRYDPMSGSLDY